MPRPERRSQPSWDAINGYCSEAGDRIEPNDLDRFPAFASGAPAGRNRSALAETRMKSIELSCCGSTSITRSPTLGNKSAWHLFASRAQLESGASTGGTLKWQLLDALARAWCAVKARMVPLFYDRRRMSILRLTVDDWMIDDVRHRVRISLSIDRSSSSIEATLTHATGARSEQVPPH